MRYYIYKLYFRNGATYVGLHREKKQNDGYVSSSFYYKKHKDLLEKREILLECKDNETLEIMETICILSDYASNPKNVNGNKGAWTNSSLFDRGFVGELNGMYGKKHSAEAKAKMRAAWTKERKEKARNLRLGTKVHRNAAMNRSKEHIEKCRQGHARYMLTQCYQCRFKDDFYISTETFNKIPNKNRKFIRVKNNGYVLHSLEEWNKLYEQLFKKPEGLRRHKIAGVLHWYNNGIEEKEFIEAPVGWRRGRLKFSKETIANMRAAMQRKLKDPEYRQKLKDGHKNPWNKGLKVPANKLKKPLLDVETGIAYESTQAARDALGTKIVYEGKKNGRFIINK